MNNSLIFLIFFWSKNCQVNNMKYICAFILLTITSVSIAQEDKVKAYLDCSRCDENFIKQETSFLDYVRDQDLADVVIFIRDIWNPSGGRSYEIEIDGNNAFTDISSTTKVSGFSSDTSSSLRDKIVNKLKLALVPFLDKAEYDLNVKIDTNFDDLEVIDDKWNYWVFELSGSYNGDKEESRKTNRYEIQFEIDKVTEDWRIGIDLERNETNREFYSDDNVYLSKRETTSLRGRVVRSISQHFSTGVFCGEYQNTFENIDFHHFESI